MGVLMIMSMQSMPGVLCSVQAGHSAEADGLEGRQQAQPSALCH